MDSDSDDYDDFQAILPTLVKAIKSENCRLLGSVILAHRVHVNRRFYDEEDCEWTCLGLAASMGCSKSVQTLLELNADPIIPFDRYQSTPLHIACENNHLNVVSILCRHASRLTALSYPNIYRDTPLHVACTHRHLDCVQILCKSGANVNATNAHNKAPLHRLIASGTEEYDLVEITTLLLKFGAEIDASDSLGRTALHVATTAGFENTVNFLLKNGADLNRQDAKGRTPLYMAVSSRQYSLAHLLLGHGASPNILAAVNNTSPLHVAAGCGDTGLIQALINNCASIDVQCKWSRTPLFEASKRGHTSAVELLLENGALVDSFDCDGNTPLLASSNEGHLTVIRVLVSKGADINAQNNFGQNPLHLACRRRDFDVVQFLLEAGAAVNMVDKSERNSLHLVCFWEIDQSLLYNNRLAVLRALVSKGVLINAQNNLGQTPLHIACNQRDFDVVQFLLEAGASVNMVDKSERNSLHLVCSWVMEESFYETRLAVLRALVSKGVLINAQDGWGNTPLHIACSVASFEVVQFLLEAGASVNLVASFGSSPLHLVRNIEIAEALVSHGSNVNLPDFNGFTPLHHVIEELAVDVAKLLISHAADVRAMNSEGTNALCVAASWNLPEMIRMLNCHFLAVERDQALVFVCKGETCQGNRHVLEAMTTLLDLGANLNYVDCNGRTALFYASEQMCVHCFEVLLNNGADIDVVDGKGKTPLMIASRSGNGDVVKLLLESGANVHAIDSKGRSALTRACAKSYNWVVRCLLEYEAGAFVLCPHKDMSQFLCLYKQYHADISISDTFEKVITKLSMANMMGEPYRGMSLLGEFPGRNGFDLVINCQIELNRLLLYKFPGTEITYMDALTQNPAALAHPECQNLLLPKYSTFWETVERNHPVYGRMIRIRLQIGLERKALVKQSFDFFHFLGINVYAAEIICRYLSNYDLRTISSVVVYKELKNTISEDPHPSEV